MFIVAAGVLEVLIPALATALPPPSSLQAGAARVSTLAPGSFFGEMSLLTGTPRTATVVALWACVLYEVPHGVMAALWAERPELAALLSTVVTEHLQRHSIAEEVVSTHTPLKRASMSRPLPSASAASCRAESAAPPWCLLTRWRRPAQPVPARC